MIVLGVTGGIGSGKTSVCRIFETLGARGFYADAEARRIMQDDPAVRRDLVAAFGPESYTSDSLLDRAYLARTVFGDAEKVQTINGIVKSLLRHPPTIALRKVKSFLKFAD
jgi:dephospho-CoA kinase